MDQLNILQREVEDIRRILQKKQEELRRFQNEVFINKHPDQEQMTIYTPQFESVSVDGVVHHTGTFNGQEPTTEGTKSNFVIEDGSKAHIGRTLPKWAIERYSRQILLPEIAVSGQEKLCSSKVLIVGAGGLGCPAAVYLAGAGVGEIGIVDYDTVDLTNIHRQFLHREEDQHLSKAESAANSIRSIHSRIKVIPYNVQLNSQNAVQIASQYDIVLDCTDNVPTRYLLNDLCVLSKLPLISGSALKMEGQLTVYGYRTKDNSNEKETYIGPCYRCLFPSPPPAEAVGSCSANGVAGPVPGAIGSLQALETIKYIVGQPHSKLLVGRMLLFDGEDMTFRTVKLRPRNPNCAVCSDSSTISELVDYELFCKAQAKEKIRHEPRSKPEIRKRDTEKTKRMTGQSYFGFRPSTTGAHKWVQDVPKSERKIGLRCKSETCARGGLKKCNVFEEITRYELFTHFWNDLDWRGKRKYVRGLVDSVPVKRRRLKLKGAVSRKGDSKMYHLLLGDDRLAVCRTMFLNTLGVKEAMVRCWLLNEDRPKAAKLPTKALNVHTYIDNLPKLPPKCQYCMNNGSKIQYIHIENIKNLFQLYNLYVQEMKLKSSSPASRKTFSKVFHLKNARIFKAKNDTDVCDVVKEHNTLPSLNYSEANVNYYYDDLDLHILPPEHRISPLQLSSRLKDCEQRHLLVDVRNEAEFNMCRIDGSVNYPIENLHGAGFEQLLGVIRKGGNNVTFICRRGNDSQVAAKKVLEAIEKEYQGRVNDLCGGLHAWSNDVDREFPIY